MDDAAADDPVIIETHGSMGNDEWDQGTTKAKELEEFVTTDAADLFQQATEASPQGVDIEADPPVFERDGESDWEFKPFGWVGQYPGPLEVVPHVIDSSTFERLQAQVAAWIATAGPGTAKSLLQFLPDVALSTTATYRSYSEQLIEQTEAVLAHRPPVRTEFTREQSRSPRGRPLPAPTIRERSKGRKQTVAQRVSFTLETLPNLLLIRFHLSLAGALTELQNNVPALGEELAGAIEYHEEFVSEQFSDELVEKALDIDFDRPDTIAETREQATPDINRMIDLWVGYREQTPLQISIQDQFQSAVKPAEKTYELYVLAQLLEMLERRTDSTARFSAKGLGAPIEIGPFELRYDLSYGSAHSRLIAELADHVEYRPDFVLVHKKDGVVWVGDAKFATGIGHDDAGRFVRYLIDLLPAGDDSPTVGTLVSPTPTEQTVTTSNGDYQVEVVTAVPGRDAAPFRRLKTIITECID